MKKVTIIGAGLVGSLLAILLSRRGLMVDVYERRPDPRRQRAAAGRSINLALSDRGFRALERAGIADAVRKVAIPMRGRTMHTADGALAFQPYGVDDQSILSVSRGGLNNALLDLAEQSARVRLYFSQRCVGADLSRSAVSLQNVDSGVRVEVEADLLFGSDGSFSSVRAEMQRLDRFNYSQHYIEHGYKELTIPAGPGGTFLLEKHALHIWPRADFMLIALPNLDGSFTCTLFLRMESPDAAPDAQSFARLRDRREARVFFAEAFPDALALMPTFDEDFAVNPTASLVTVRCSPWTHGDRVCLVGDAAHAIVPFYGQGMNAGFEDCTILDALLAEHGDDWSAVLQAFDRRRKTDTDAIAELALENFVEMRDKVADPAFLFRKRVEAVLAQLCPERFTPLYTMVTFSQMPYAEAAARGRAQDAVLERVLRLPGIEEGYAMREMEPSLVRIVEEMLPLHGFGTSKADAAPIPPC